MTKEPSTELATLLDELDERITAVTEQVMDSIAEDRDRAEQLYLELLNAFYQGKNSPDDLRELNNAQGMIQGTTEQYQKVLTNLTRIKQGDTRIQIANITQEAKKLTDASDGVFDIKTLNDHLDKLQNETIVEQVSEKD